MATTPLWVPLAAAGLAVVGTLGGVVFTQMWNGRLEGRRWAREDVNRTYEHRRAAYVEFLQELERLQRRFIDPDWEPVEPPARHDPVFNSLNDRFSALLVYGTVEAHKRAVKCFHCLQHVAVDAQYAAVDAEEGIDFWVAKADYITQIRVDLGVPERTPAEDQNA
jgi:hypothetical protein